MKKLLNVKNLIVALVLVVGLTGIASFVSASEPIATIQYAGKDPIKISKETKDIPNTSIWYQDFKNQNVEIDIFDYPTENIELSVLIPDSVGEPEVLKKRDENPDAPYYEVISDTDSGKEKVQLNMTNLLNGDGVYKIQAKQVGSDNIDFEIDIIVDNTPPVVEVFLGKDEENKELISNKDNLKPKYSANELTVKVQDENFDPENHKGTYTIPGVPKKNDEDKVWTLQNGFMVATFVLPQGENTLDVTVTDEAGNEFVLPGNSNPTFIVDTEGPNIDISIKNEKYISGLDIRIEDKHSPLDFHLDLDSTNIEICYKQNENEKDWRCDDTYTLEKKSDNVVHIKGSDNLGNGILNINVTALDELGNSNNMTIKSLILDKTIPGLTVEFTKISEDSSSDNEVSNENLYKEPTYVNIIIDEQHFEEAGLKFEDLKFEELKEELKKMGNPTWKHEGNIHTATYTPEDGEYEFKVLAEDLAENQSKPKSLSFMIDTKAPEINLGAYVDDNSLSIEQENEKIDLGVHQNLNIYSEIKDENLNSKTETFSLVRLEDNVQIFENEQIINHEFNLNFSEKDSTNESTAQEGTYKLTITAEDKAGRTSNKEITFSIDRTRPIVKDYVYINNDQVLKPIEKEDGTLVFSNHPTIIFQVDEAFFDPNGVVLKKDGQVLDSSKLNWKTVGEITHQAELSFTQDGIYTIEIDVKDKADNVAEKKPNLLTFVVDTAAPEITIDGYEELSNSDQSVNLKVSDLTLNHISYEVIKSNNLIEGQTTVLKSEEITITENDQNLFEFNIPIEVEVAAEEDVTITVTVKANDFITTINNVDEEVKSTHTTTLDKSFEVDKVKPVVYYKLNDEIIQDKGQVEGVKYYSGESLIKSESLIKIYINEYHFDSSKVNINLTGKWELVEGWQKVTHDGIQYEVATIKVEDDGNYELKNIEVTDQADNTATSKQEPQKFVIDTVAPTIGGLDDFKNEFYYKKGDKVIISGSITETNLNKDLSTYTVCRKQSLKAQETCITKSFNSVIDSENNFTLPALTENGEYRVVLTAKDMSDNQVEKDTELHFYIDHNDPKVSIKPVTANTANGSQQNVSEVVIGLSATDDWKLANTKYTVKRNNEVINVPKQGEWDDFKLSFKDEGYYQVEIETGDQAGTKTVKETLEFTIDRTSPAQLSIVGNANHHNSTTSVKDGESYSAPRVNLQFTAQDMYSFNKIKVDVTKNGKAYASQTFDVKEAREDFTNTFSKNANYSLSEEGEYEVTFTVYDQAGNQSDQKLSFEIDRTTPIITSNIEDGKYYNEDFLPEFTLDQPERDEFTFINIDGKNYKNSIPFLINDKVYTISALATDKAQNTIDYNATITIDKTSPTIGISNLITGFFKDTLSPSIFYNDTNLDSSKVSIKLNNVELGAGVGDENGYTKEININKDGNYTLEVSIGDLATNVSKQTIDFVLDNEKPIIKIKNKISLHNQPWIPELEVLEEHGYDVVMATLNGEEYDITQPITTEGKNVLFLQVADKSGNTESITVEFILDLTPPKVIVENSETNQLVKEGEHYLTSLDLKIYLDYIEGESQEYEEAINTILLNDEPQNLNVTMENGRKVYHLPLNEFKDYTLTVKATDSAGNETVETITFTLGDKDIFTKIYENKPVFYSLITITGLAVLGSGVYGVIVLKSKSKNKEDSSEE